MQAGLAAMSTAGRETATDRLATAGRNRRFGNWAEAQGWLKSLRPFMEVLRSGYAIGNELRPSLERAVSAVLQSNGVTAQQQADYLPEIVARSVRKTHAGTDANYRAYRDALWDFLFTRSPRPDQSAHTAHLPGNNIDVAMYLINPSGDFQALLASWDQIMPAADQALREQTGEGLLGQWGQLRATVLSRYQQFEAAKKERDASPRRIQGFAQNFNGYRAQVQRTLVYANNTITGTGQTILVGVEVNEGGSIPDLVVRDRVRNRLGRPYIREIKDWTTFSDRARISEQSSRMRTQTIRHFEDYNRVVIVFTDQRALTDRIIARDLAQIDDYVAGHNRRPNGRRFVFETEPPR